MKRFTLILVCCLVVTACGVPTDDSPRLIPPNRVPAELLTPSTTAPPVTEPVQTASVDVFMVKGRRLAIVKRMVADPPTVGAVLATLVQGPSESEVRSGVVSVVDAETGVLGAQVDGSTAIINVGSGFAEISRDEQTIAMAQMVYTATNVAGVDAVQVRIDGVPAEVPRQDGSLTSERVGRDSYSKFAP